MWSGGRADKVARRLHTPCPPTPQVVPVASYSRTLSFLFAAHDRWICPLPPPPPPARRGGGASGAAAVARPCAIAAAAGLAQGTLRGGPTRGIRGWPGVAAVSRPPLHLALPSGGEECWRGLPAARRPTPGHARAAAPPGGARSGSDRRFKERAGRGLAPTAARRVHPSQQTPRPPFWPPPRVQHPPARRLQPTNVPCLPSTPPPPASLPWRAAGAPPA